MKIKHLLLFVLLLATAVGVSACTRSASTPPPAPGVTQEGMPVPGTQTMGLFDTFATQTALAGEAGGGVPQETPVPPTAEEPAPQPTEPQSGEQPQPQPPPQTQEETPQQPAAPAVVSEPPPTFEVPERYTLQKGEHVYCISRRFDLNPADVLSLNGLGVNTVVQPGTELRIPQTGRGFPEARALRAHPTTYTVRSGDTINSIACYFGDVDPRAIAHVNGLEAPYNLSSGQNLQIP
jgi:LysM repeat protein